MATKKFGQLFENRGTLKDRVEKLNLGAAPTSPLGAQSIGANPDAVKMVGTPAQRQNAVRQQMAKPEVAPEQPQQAQTLAGAQRLAGPQQARAADQEAQERAQRLRQLGSLSSRVQSQVEQMIQQAPQGLQQGQIDADENLVAGALGIDPSTIETNRPLIQQAQTAIADYMQAPSEEKLVGLLELGIPRSQVYQITNTLEDGTQATADTLAEALGDELTVDQLDVAELGFQDVGELSAAVGSDVTGMTVPELRDAVQRARNETYDEIETLQAELAALPRGSAQANLIRQRLRELGDRGITGAESAVAEATEKLEFADVVEVAGQEFKVEELLDNQQFSDLIEEYMTAPPEIQEQMFDSEAYSGLKSWIEGNKEALSALVQGAQDTQQTFEEANREWAALSQDTLLDPELISTLSGLGYDPGAAATSSELNQLRTNLESTGLGQIALEGENPNLLSSVDNENIDMLKGWSREAVETSYELAQDLVGDEIAQTLTGLQEVPSFVSEEQMQTIRDRLPVINKLKSIEGGELLVRSPQFVDAVQKGTIDEEWLDVPNAIDVLDDSRILNLIEKGEITKDQAQTWFEDADEKLLAYDRFQAEQASLETAVASGDLNEMIQAAYAGQDMPSVEQLQANLGAAQLAAAFGDPNAAAYAAELEQILDPQTYSNLAAQDIGLKKVLEEGPQAGEGLVADAPATGRLPFEPQAGTARTLSEFGADGQITVDELASAKMSTRDLANLYEQYNKIPPEQRKAFKERYGFPSIGEVAAQRARIELAQAVPQSLDPSPNRAEAIQQNLNSRLGGMSVTDGRSRTTALSFAQEAQENLARVEQHYESVLTGIRRQQEAIKQQYPESAFRRQLLARLQDRYKTFNNQRNAEQKKASEYAQATRDFVKFAETADNWAASSSGRRKGVGQQNLNTTFAKIKDMFQEGNFQEARQATTAIRQWPKLLQEKMDQTYRQRKAEYDQKVQENPVYARVYQPPTRTVVRQDFPVIPARRELWRELAADPVATARRYG